MSNRKTFTVGFNSTVPHNSILIKPLVNIKIVDIYTVDVNAEKIRLLDLPIEIDSDTSIRYETIFSGKIWIELEGTYVSELSIDDLLVIEASLAKYNTIGEYSSEEGRISFHKYISTVWDISNVKDVLIDGDLGIRTLDRYGNIIYDETIPISLNDDGFLVEYANSGLYIELPVKPAEGSIRILVDGEYTEEFSLEGTRVNIDIPSNVDCYVIYKPYYLESGAQIQTSSNVWINPNGEIKLRDDNCDTILFTYTVRMYNTNITSTNHTPIIKSLGIVASSQ